MKLTELIEGNENESVLKQILSNIHNNGPVDLADLEKLAIIKKNDVETFAKYESKLVYLLGLFFKTTRPKSFVEKIYSLFGEQIHSSTGRLFTPVQASAYKEIVNHTYFSFSAPTSSGKSFLFRELIKETCGDIVIVVPSRALIAEYIASVIKIVDSSVLVLQFIENVNRNYAKRRVFIITPERGVELFKHKDDFNIELFLFDEAQISEEQIRGMRFDSFVRRADKTFPDAKKVFTHPFISNPEAQLKKHNFQNKTSSENYRQNSVGKIYLSVVTGGLKYFSPFNEKPLKNGVECTTDIVEEILAKPSGTLLIFTAKGKIYDGRFKESFQKYMNLCAPIKHPNAIEIVDELRSFIGATKELTDKHSILIELMEKGIVFHHGSIPLKARLLIEEFVKKGFAKICYATSTLMEGINMPFDVVWIDNFKFNGSESQKALDLKNLIGRAGRTSRQKGTFDFGYVVVPERSVKLFCSRMNKQTVLSEESALDSDISTLPEDSKDIAEAIQNDSFLNEYHLTQSQVERIDKSDIEDDIKLILDSLVVGNGMITASQYYDLKPAIRDELKQAFKRVFVSHLRRQVLNKAESLVLSASIPMLLWKIQGKSFAEIVSLRYAYITQQTEQNKIRRDYRKGLISRKDAREKISSLNFKFSPIAVAIPDSTAKTTTLFSTKASVTEFQYDTLVYDTYDYLDKVISFSLTDPLFAVFGRYYTKTNDKRALLIQNFIKYGTNNYTEIMLLKYGFGFEDIEWIKEYVFHIDEYEIVFFPAIEELDEKRYKVISRFVN